MNPKGRRGQRQMHIEGRNQGKNTRRMHAVWIIVCGWIAATGAADNPHPIEPAIRIEQFPPTSIMVAKHVGPYWEAGPLFRQATALMQASRQEGPLLTYYPRNPLNVAASQLIGEIGFFLDGDSPDQAPFQRKVMPAYQAAVITVESDYGQTQRFYTDLEDFIRNRGLQPTGAIMEIYHGPPDLAADQKQRPRTEIRMWIKSQVVAMLTPPTPSEPPEPVELTPHEKLAIAMIPQTDDCPDGYRKWMTRIVNRLRAIREAAAVKYADDPPELVPLIDAVIARGRHMAELRDSEEVIVDVAPPQALLNRLDDLLVDTLLRNEDGAILTQEVESVIREFTALIHPVTPSTDSTITDEANR